MPDPSDPRPLTSEPLALDLVNTTWRDDAGTHDLLADPARASAWLRRWALPEATGRPALSNLLTTRAAMRGVLEQPGDKAGHDAFDAVLERGRVRLTLADGVPGEHVEVPDDWRASWLAARDMLRLLEERSQRIRHCANPDCVLWFDDATRSGTRRWCSMAGCGNRLKARRHYGRQRARGGGSST